MTSISSPSMSAVAWLSVGPGNKTHSQNYTWICSQATELCTLVTFWLEYLPGKLEITGSNSIQGGTSAFFPWKTADCFECLPTYPSLCLAVSMHVITCETHVLRCLEVFL